MHANSNQTTTPGDHPDVDQFSRELKKSVRYYNAVSNNNLFSRISWKAEPLALSEWFSATRPMHRDSGSLTKLAWSMQIDCWRAPGVHRHWAQ
jgi:hypothetical protein